MNPTDLTVVPIERGESGEEIQGFYPFWQSDGRHEGLPPALGSDVAKTKGILVS